jgi:D-3-phosphoglycerate dehydrogenase
LGGFYADVYPYEPKSNGTWCSDLKDPVQADLFKLATMKNVIFTSHTGGSTIEGQIAIAVDVSQKLLSFISTGSTIDAVNVPQLSLPIKPNCYRILNFHHNSPGALRDLNKCLEKFNIVQQTLSTLGRIGYCITDVEKPTELDIYKFDAKEINEILSKLEHTLRNSIIFPISS